MRETTASLGALFAWLDTLAKSRATGETATEEAALAEVHQAVTTVAQTVLRPMETTPAPPPRAVGVAMAHALFAVPHISATMSAKTTLSETSSFVPTDPLAEALGLPRWEVDDIREEVDYRVAMLLKQVRALQWLWTRQDHPRINPAPLISTLFPGAPPGTDVHFSRSGLRLYAAVDDEPAPPTSSLYLTWRSTSRGWPRQPDLRFDARYVDASLLRAMGRALGTSAEEARSMLANLVCVIPKSQRDHYITHDRWRSEGWADLTGIGVAGTGASWITRALAPDALDEEDWLEATSEGIALRGARRVFDRHALARITAITRASFAELLARELSKQDAPGPAEAALFDLSPAIQRGLQPMLDWAASSRTHAHVARKIGATEADVAAALSQVRQSWLNAAQTSWGGIPSPQRPHTVQTILATHLALSQASLRRSARMAPDPRMPHRKVILLFMAHYAAAAPIGRLWRPVDGALPPPEDVLGEWFWGCWQRVLDCPEE